LYLNDRDLRQLPLIQRKEKLRRLIERSGSTDIICGKYVEERGIDLFNEVCKRNLEGVVAKPKNGTHSAVSGWLKIKNPNYTQSDQRHELFESFKSKATRLRLAPVPKKPPRRTRQRKMGNLSMTIVRTFPAQKRNKFSARMPKSSRTSL